MQNKKLWVALVVIMVIATWAGVSYPKTSSDISVERIISEVKAKLGSSVGPESLERQFHRNGTTNGGLMATTTGLTATYTVVNGEFNQTPTVIKWRPNINQTVNLTATSTFPYLPNIGDSATVYFQNASTTAGATITFAASNANVDLQFAEATGGDLVLNGLDWAKMTFIRASSTVVTIIFDEMTEAD